MPYNVTAPNDEFSGTREGVEFKNGKGKAKTRAQALNLKQRGFEVPALDKATATSPTAPKTDDTPPTD